LLANAVRDLYDRDLEALGQSARQRVLDRYSWDQALQMQLNSCTALIGAAAHRNAPGAASAPLEVTT
jgi:hypothetical protein